MILFYMALASKSTVSFKPGLKWWIKSCIIQLTSLNLIFILRENFFFILFFLNYFSWSSISCLRIFYYPISWVGTDDETIDILSSDMHFITFFKIWEVYFLIFSKSFMIITRRTIIMLTTPHFCHQLIYL